MWKISNPIPRIWVVSLAESADPVSEQVFTDQKQAEDTYLNLVNEACGEFNCEPSDLDIYNEVCDGIRYQYITDGSTNKVVTIKEHNLEISSI